MYKVLAPCVDDFYEVAADAYLRQIEVTASNGELTRMFHALAVSWPRANRRGHTNELESLKVWLRNQSSTQEQAADDFGYAARHAKRLAPKGSELMVEELVAPRSWYIEAIPVDGVVYVVEPKTPGRRNE